MPKKFDEKLKMPEERFGNIVVEEHSSVLAIILGMLIVFLMLILAGLYVWGEYLNKPPVPEPVSVTLERPNAEENNEPESTTAEAEVETMSAISTSDEISAIESDLSGTFVDSLDAEFVTIEGELGALNSQQ